MSEGGQDRSPVACSPQPIPDAPCPALYRLLSAAIGKKGGIFMNHNPEPPTPWSHGQVSSLFDKLSPSHRQQLDRAIVQRDPPRLIDAYNLFQLGLNGIGPAAFYRYAARLRAT